MPRVDLHIHSYYSDGEESPSVILERTKGLDLFSITDHNFILPDINLVMTPAGITTPLFIQGVEISSLDKTTGRSLHILGYSRSFKIGRLNKALEPLINGYNQRAERILGKLRHVHPGFTADFKDLEKKAQGPYISRNLIAAELRSFLRQTISMETAIKEAYVEENNSWMLSDVEAVKMIAETGGIPVLAHPGRLAAENVWFNQKMRELRQCGLRGLEVHYPFYTESQIGLLATAARDLGLITTGGSDWHGENYTPGRQTGCDLSDEEYNLFINTLPSV